MKNSAPLIQPREIVCGMITIVVSVLFWLFLSFVIPASHTLTAHWSTFVMITLLAFLGLGAWFAMLALMTFMLQWGVFIVIAVAMTALGFLFFDPTWYIAFGFLIFFIGAVVYQYRMKRLSTNEMELRLAGLIRRSIGPLLTALLLLIALIYYADVRKLQPSDADTISNLSVGVGNLANQLLPGFVPNYQPDLTLDEFLLNSAKSSMNAKPSNEGEIPPEVLDDLSLKEIKRFVPDQELTKMRNEFLKPFGLEGLDGDTEMTLVIQKIVDAKAQEWLQPVAPFIPPFMAVGVFLLLNVFRWAYLLLIQGFAVLVHRLFLAIGWTEIKKEEAKKDILQLSTH